MGADHADDGEPRRSTLLRPDGTVTAALSLAFWVYVVVTSAGLFVGALAVWVVSLAVDRCRLRGLHLYTSAWAFHYANICPFFSVTVDRANLPEDGQAVVFVSNHQSTLDIITMYGLYTHFKWVSKSSNFYIPFIGWNMLLNDYVPLKRGSRASVGRMFAHCERHLAAGNPVFFFPEGTRSLDGELKPFKAGAFELAIRAGVPVVPVALSGAGQCLRSRSSLFNGGGWRVNLKVLPAVPVDRLGEDADELAARVRALIEAEVYANP